MSKTTSANKKTHTQFVECGFVDNNRIPGVYVNYEVDDYTGLILSVYLTDLQGKRIDGVQKVGSYFVAA